MNDKRSSRALFILPLLLILGFHESYAQDDFVRSSGDDKVIDAPEADTDVCSSTAPSCSECVQDRTTDVISYACTCCPKNYFCCTPKKGVATCCPKNSGICDAYGCALTTNYIPSTSICSTCGAMNLSIVGDNTIEELYLDGAPYVVSAANNWPNAGTFGIPAGSKVLAAKVSDVGAIAGLLASTTYGYLITSSAWKCTKQFYANWMQPTYDDVSPNPWPNAIAYHANGVFPHGLKPEISTAAMWIWTANYQGAIDTPVYCRGYFPTASCQLGYGQCSNLCAGSTTTPVCCGCSLSGGGPSTTMSCNCCPTNYQCCTNSNGVSTCCPPGSVCQGGRCVTSYYLGPRCGFCKFDAYPYK